MRGMRQMRETSGMEGYYYTCICIRYMFVNTVTDPECLSRIMIFIRPGSRIPEPGSNNNNNNKRGVGVGICCPTFFCSHRYHNIKNVLLFYFWTGNEIFFSQLPKNYGNFYWENMVLGSGMRKNLLRIPDPGIKKHRIRIRNTVCKTTVAETTVRTYVYLKL